MKKFLLLLLASMLLVISVSYSACGQESASSDSDAVWKTVKDAYVFSFPLVIMDATKTVSVNTEKPVPGKAPVNQIMHYDALVNADFKTVVAPNADTLYSQVWYDVSKEPMVYIHPETDRFCKVELLDAWTNNFKVIDKAGTYVLALPSWKGELPDNVTRIDAPTAMVWAITRTILYGEDDIKNVKDIQEKMRVLPLSAYLSGKEYEAPKGSFSEENEFNPLEKVLSMSPDDFFNRANALMIDNPPAEADEAIMKEIAGINVGPGLKFDSGKIPGDITALWKDMLDNLSDSLTAESEKFIIHNNQWTFYGAPIGNFGTEYAYRALIALTGIGANTVDVAIYPAAYVDKDGKTLDGSNDYVLHFDSFPKVLDNGFWSVTAYNADSFLIDNPIDRYCVNDRTGLKVNEDGTADVIISKSRPEDKTNWLPVSDGKFFLVMRIYTPDAKALSAWKAPVISPVSGSGT